MTAAGLFVLLDRRGVGAEVVTQTLVERLTALAAGVGTRLAEHLPRLVPAGGAVGQVLTKASVVDFDAQWAAPATNLHVGPEAPSFTSGLWVQTGLGEDQTGTTLWIITP